MKVLRYLGALALAACVSLCLSLSPALAVPSTTWAPDSASILGTNPGFLYGVTYDQYGNAYKSIIDSTPTTPAAVGKWVYWTGSTWIQGATANVPLHPGQYGVVVNAASAQGGTALIQVQGYNATASVKTGGSVACAATGDVPLAITTTGDVTPTVAATVPGVTWGICAGVLAISQPATPTPVYIGGY